MSGKMSEKSEVAVLAVQLADCSQRDGMKKVLRRLQPRVPVVNQVTGKCQKTTLFGDHGFAAMGKYNQSNSVYHMFSLQLTK